MRIVILYEVLALSVIVGVVQVSTSYVQAQKSSSTDYGLNSIIDGSFGGRQASTNYALQSTGGEPIVGSGAGGSYKLTEGYTAQLNKSLQLNVQPNGLVGYWPLDDVIPNAMAIDASANSNNGTYSVASISKAAKVGTGWGDTNANQSITIPDSPSFPTSSAMTISGWFLRSSNTLPRTIMSKWDFTTSPSTHGSWRLDTSQSAAQLRLYVRNGVDNATNYVDTTNASIASDTWYHVAVVYDGSQSNANRVTFYLNGVKLLTSVTGTVATSIASSSDPAVIGNTTGIGGIGWSGALDEMKLYNRVLSPNGAKAEYDAGIAGIPAGLSLNSVTPGLSQSSAVDAIVKTDAAGYTIGVSQNQNLTSGSYTVPPVSGLIASPVAWNEGITKGLGFSLYGTTATAIPVKWNSGNSYAALPTSSTSFYTRTGLSGGIKDVINMRLRLDVANSQASGAYTNQATFTGTMTP